MNPFKFQLSPSHLSKSPQKRKIKTFKHTKLESMEDFYSQWVIREQELLSSLLSTDSLISNNHGEILHSTLSHLESYYTEKSHLANQNILQAFYPNWLNPFERTFLWLGGFKPSLAFKFLPAAGDQLRQLRHATAAEERVLALEMARLQESLASPAVLAAVRAGDRNGEAARAEAVAGDVAAALRALLAAADGLRQRTVREIVEMLSPDQAVEFLASALSFHISVRRFGLQWNNRN